MGKIELVVVLVKITSNDKEADNTASLGVYMKLESPKCGFC